MSSSPISSKSLLMSTQKFTVSLVCLKFKKIFFNQSPPRTLRTKQESEPTKAGISSQLRSSENREVGLGSHSLIPYPNLPPSPISPMVSVDVKHRDRRRYILKLSGVSDCAVSALACWNFSPVGLVLLLPTLFFPTIAAKLSASAHAHLFRKRRPSIFYRRVI